MANQLLIFYGDRLIDTPLAQNKEEEDVRFLAHPIGSMGVKLFGDSKTYRVYMKANNLSSVAEAWVPFRKQYKFEDLPLSEVQKAQVLLVPFL